MLLRRAPWTLALTLSLAAWALPGCAAEAGSSDPATSADEIIGSTSLAELCSVPVSSEDGTYVALDECPIGANPGNLVRVNVKTGARRVIATYPTQDSIVGLTSSHGRLVFGVLHDSRGERKGLSGLGPNKAASGLDLNVRDWELTQERTFTLETGVSTENDVVESWTRVPITVTDDGNYVALHVRAKRSDTRATTDTFVVAPTSGRAAPAKLDLHRAPWRLWAAGNRMIVSYDTLEGDVELVDIGGPDVATSRALSNVPSAGYANTGGPSSVQPGEQPFFDGKIIVGNRRSGSPATERLVGLDLATGAEITLDAGPDFRGVHVMTRVGSDVIYQVSHGDPADVKKPRHATLRRIPVAGGGPAILHTNAPLDARNSGFGGTTLLGARYMVAHFTADAGGGRSASLIDLDGATPPVSIHAPASTSTVVGVRSSVLTLFVETAAGSKSFTQVNLTSGTVTSTPLPDDFASDWQAVAGDNALLGRAACATPGSATNDGFQTVRYHGGASDVAPCQKQRFTRVVPIGPNAETILVRQDRSPVIWAASLLKP